MGLEVCAASDSLCEDLALVVELEREAAEGVLEPLKVQGVEFGVQGPGFLGRERKRRACMHASRRRKAAGMCAQCLGVQREDEAKQEDAGQIVRMNRMHTMSRARWRCKQEIYVRFPPRGGDTFVTWE